MTDEEIESFFRKVNSLIKTAVPEHSLIMCICRNYFMYDFIIGDKCTQLYANISRAVMLQDVHVHYIFLRDFSDWGGGGLLFLFYIVYSTTNCILCLSFEFIDLYNFRS